MACEGGVLQRTVDADVVEAIAGGEIFGAWKAGPSLHDFAIDIQTERAVEVLVWNTEDFLLVEEPDEFGRGPKKGADVEVFREIEWHDLMMPDWLVVESDARLHIGRLESMEGCKVGAVESGLGDGVRGVAAAEYLENVDFFGEIALSVFGGRIEGIVQPEGVADIGAHGLETGFEVAVQDTLAGGDISRCIDSHAAGAVEGRNFIRLLHSGRQFEAAIPEADIAAVEISGSAAKPLRG